MNLNDAFATAMIVVLTTLTAEYAKDFKVLVNKLYKKIRKKLGVSKPLLVDDS